MPTGTEPSRRIIWLIIGSLDQNWPPSSWGSHEVTFPLFTHVNLRRPFCVNLHWVNTNQQEQGMKCQLHSQCESTQSTLYLITSAHLAYADSSTTCHSSKHSSLQVGLNLQRCYSSPKTTTVVFFYCNINITMLSLAELNCLTPDTMLTCNYISRHRV